MLSFFLKSKLHHRRVTDARLDYMGSMTFDPDFLDAAGISKIEIDRTANMVNVVIWTSKPGMIIGQKGATIDQLKEDISPSSRTSVQPSVLTASPFRMSRPIFQADMRQSACVTSAPAR